MRIEIEPNRENPEPFQPYKVHNITCVNVEIYLQEILPFIHWTTLPRSVTLTANLQTQREILRFATMRRREILATSQSSWMTETVTSWQSGSSTQERADKVRGRWGDEGEVIAPELTTLMITPEFKALVTHTNRVEIMTMAWKFISFISVII